MFRFTIRDLLWLTLLAAVAVAWWVDRRRLEQTVNTQAEDIARLNKEMENRPQVRLWPPYPEPTQVSSNWPEPA
jgi:hypothetical protein